MIGLSLLFFLGHGLNWFFQKTKIPDLLLLVILGYVLGPLLGWVSASDLGVVGGVLSTTALIVILYEGGLNLSTKDLLTSSLPALGLSTLSFLSIAVLGGLSVYLLGLQSPQTAILLGVAIGSTSSAIVIPMVKPLSVEKSTKTILSLESAFTDVLAIVIFLGLVEAFAGQGVSTTEMILGMGSNPIVSVAIGVGAALVAAFAKKQFVALESMTFAGEAWALLVYGGIEFFQFNGAIGVLALGFTLANLDLLPGFLRQRIDVLPISYEDMSLLSVVTFLLRTFFFIYLGILVKFSEWSTVIMAVGLALLIVVTRYLTVRLLFQPKSTQRLDAMVAVAMGPRGLACAVLATVPLQRGLEGGPWLQSVIFALIPMTIFLTAVFVGICESNKLRGLLEGLFQAYPDNLPMGDSKQPMPVSGTTETPPPRAFRARPAC